MYSFSVELAMPADQAMEKLTATLQQHKLGIVSEVNVQAIFKAKLGEDIAPYRILGACAPGLAKRVIEAQPEAGTLLPCNIVVREKGQATIIDFMDPVPVLALAGDEQIQAVAEEARAILQKVATALAA